MPETPMDKGLFLNRKLLKIVTVARAFYIKAFEETVKNGNIFNTPLFLTFFSRPPSTNHFQMLARLLHTL